LQSAAGGSIAHTVKTPVCSLIPQYIAACIFSGKVCEKDRENCCPFSVGGMGGIRLHVEHCKFPQDGADVAENRNTLPAVSKVAVHTANSLLGFKTNASAVTQALMLTFKLH
jgi:hypothetical protein